jgi:Holliday junction resolvase-like predicted endonuclease
MAKPARAGKRAFGEAKESEAASFLVRQGLTLVCRNFQCKLGEIDLVMRSNDTLVFVEVRFRRSSLLRKRGCHCRLAQAGQASAHRAVLFAAFRIA